MRTTFTLSVLHCGTTFTEALLNSFSRGFHHVHNELDPITLAKARAATVIVIPLRNPERVWESFITRGLDKLLYEYSWFRLNHIVNLFPSILYLPIDLEGYRNMQLRLLGEVLGKRLTTDWAPMGTYTGPRPDVMLPLDKVPALPFYT